MICVYASLYVQMNMMFMNFHQLSACQKPSRVLGAKWHLLGGHFSCPHLRGTWHPKNRLQVRGRPQ